jgi:hypothetical protein
LADHRRIANDPSAPLSDRYEANRWLIRHEIDRLRTKWKKNSRKIAELTGNVYGNPCTTSLGSDKGTTIFTYLVEISSQPETDMTSLLDRARQHWTAQKYKVGDVLGANTAAPSLLAEQDGYTLSLSVDRGRRTASLGGTTPCVKDAGQSRPG